MGPAKGLATAGAATEAQRGHVALGVFKWLKKKLSGLKKSGRSTYDTSILEPMLARIKEGNQQRSPGSMGGTSGATDTQQGTYESVILEPMLQRSQTPRGVADGIPPSAGAPKQKTEKPAQTANQQDDTPTFEALLVAVNKGEAADVRKLLEAGANPDEQDGYGWTPLRYAVRGGHMDAALALIESGADVDLASNTGRTPLMSAAGNGLSDMVEMLLKAGADHKAVNKAGETAFRISMRGGVLGCAECRVLLTIS